MDADIASAGECAGLRISEALVFNETDIDTGRGSLLIRHGKGDKRREAGMDQRQALIGA